MPYTKIELWKPKGIDVLEPNAWKALRNDGNSLIIAGPGAGKTEFLAQRVCYLLETGLCPAPQRILAISFKSDAADNLGKRVRERCIPERAKLFSSITFDSFTKSVVDRFRLAIPEVWRPSKDYEIIFPNRNNTQAFLTQARIGAGKPEWQAAIAAIQTSEFEPRCVGSARLPNRPADPKSGVGYAIALWWEQHLRSRQGCQLSFVMINRLAEFLIRTNPEIARAVRSTYRYVFIDEFQDTTYAQYGFLSSAFQDTSTSLTSVGDSKQRIMVWAGARADAFDVFKQDFNATPIPLIFNFRSSPGLVQIQQVVAKAIESTTANVESQVKGEIDGDVTQVWKFPTISEEAAVIATWLRNQLKRGETSPRQYALLVRQTADKFEQQLSPAFEARGLRLRNESKSLGRSTLQDLLSEQFTCVVIAFFRLALTKRSPGSWRTASEAIERLRAVNPDDHAECNQVSQALSTFVKEAKLTFLSGFTLKCLEEFFDRIIVFTDLDAWKRAYIEYSTGERLAIAVEAFKLHLVTMHPDVLKPTDWIDSFEGIGQIPLMTVHKSKGLEYHTIIFVGLDDDAWWSHTPKNLDGLATFFVALSRAKQRAIFTFCQERGNRTKVAEFYGLLEAAGVSEVAPTIKKC